MGLRVKDVGESEGLAVMTGIRIDGVCAHIIRLEREQTSDGRSIAR